MYVWVENCHIILFNCLRKPCFGKLEFVLRKSYSDKWQIVRIVCRQLYFFKEVYKYMSFFVLQEELADRIASLIHCFGKVNQKFLFVHTFFLTMAREWYGIDRLRLDKFMMVGFSEQLEAVCKALYQATVWCT